MLRKSAEQGLNVLVVGERGSGKTTLLRQLALDLRERQTAVVFVDGKLATDAYSFLELIRYQLGRAPNLLEAVRDRYARAPQPRPNLGPSATVLELIDSLRDPTGDQPRTVLLVDGVPSTDEAHTLFGRLRDELWQLGVTWGVAASPEHAGALLSPPADAFFERRITLDELDRPARFQLLRFRGVPADRAEPLATDGPGNPRDLVALARDAEENGLSPEVLAAAAEQRRSDAEEVAGRAGGQLVAELAGLGPVSAGDPRLLDRLGWDRPRAARTLSRLERAGVVRSHLEARNGRNGRPRKLYELIPAADLASS
jgi:energy-coupling factor transporter ATP-binding protein EcfA2